MNVTECPVSFARLTDAMRAALDAFRSVYWRKDHASEYQMDNLCDDWGLLFDVGGDVDAFGREHAPRAALAGALFGWLSLPWLPCGCVGGVPAGQCAARHMAGWHGDPRRLTLSTPCPEHGTRPGVECPRG